MDNGHGLDSFWTPLRQNSKAIGQCLETFFRRHWDDAHFDYEYEGSLEQLQSTIDSFRVWTLTWLCRFWPRVSRWFDAGGDQALFPQGCVVDPQSTTGVRREPDAGRRPDGQHDSYKLAPRIAACGARKIRSAEGK